MRSSDTVANQWLTGQLRTFPFFSFVLRSSCWLTESRSFKRWSETEVRLEVESFVYDGNLHYSSMCLAFLLFI